MGALRAANPQDHGGGRPIPLRRDRGQGVPARHQRIADASGAGWLGRARHSPNELTPAEVFDQVLRALRQYNAKTIESANSSD
jgi:hypothetical protein